mmetsp:Transcript_51927/g.151277  ORF Transcript_51927/g.151277 Transcript_51927/m.151277 type:complete len:243 (+) Transcript_51927:2135-2863(+)
MAPRPNPTRRSFPTAVHARQTRRPWQRPAASLANHLPSLPPACPPSALSASTWKPEFALSIPGFRLHLWTVTMHARPPRRPRQLVAVRLVALGCLVHFPLCPNLHSSFFVARWMVAPALSPPIPRTLTRMKPPCPRCSRPPLATLFVLPSPRAPSPPISEACRPGASRPCQRSDSAPSELPSLCGRHGCGRDREKAPWSSGRGTPSRPRRGKPCGPVRNSDNAMRGDRRPPRSRKPPAKHRA